MGDRRDIDQLLVSWLEDGARGGSPGYLEETLALIDVAPQRRWAGTVRRAIPFARPVIGTSPRLAQLALVVLLGLALVAALLLVGSRPRPAPPIGPAGNGLIAFTDGRAAYILDPFDGRPPRVVRGGLGGAINATFSPDGTMLAYFSWDPEFGHSGGPLHLFVTSSDGSEVARQVSHIPMWDGYDVDPAWSPDSTRIAYHGYDVATNSQGLYVARVDRPSVAQIVRGGDLFGYASPEWSPDGRWIAYRDMSFDVPDGTALMIVAADGGERRHVRTAPGRLDTFGMLAWSPDGSRLAYEIRRSAAPIDFAVATFDLDRHEEHTISAEDDRGVLPAWSSDGRWLAYLESPRTGPNVWSVIVVDRDGGGRRDLGPVADCHIRWSPDNRYLLGYAPGCTSGLVVVAVDGTEPVTTIDVADLSGTPSWQRVAP